MGLLAVLCKVAATGVLQPLPLPLQLLTVTSFCNVDDVVGVCTSATQTLLHSVIIASEFVAVTLPLFVPQAVASMQLPSLSAAPPLRRVHRHEVSLAAIGSWHVLSIALLPAATLPLLSQALPLQSPFVMGMLFMAAVLIGLDTRFDSDLMGDCSKTGEAPAVLLSAVAVVRVLWKPVLLAATGCAKAEGTLLGAH